MSLIEQKDIKELLFKMGAPTNTKGYKYLVSAIEKVMDDNFIPMCSELYPEIAKEFGAVSHGAVEKCIRYTVKETLINCPVEYLHDIFKGRTQMSNSRFISCVVEYLSIKRGKKRV